MLPSNRPQKVKIGTFKPFRSNSFLLGAMTLQNVKKSFFKRQYLENNRI